MQVDESKIKWRQFVSGDNESYSWIYILMYKFYTGTASVLLLTLKS